MACGRHERGFRGIRELSALALSCLGGCWNLQFRCFSPVSLRISRQDFHSRHVGQWTAKRKSFEAFLASLEHPRVRDLAWSVLGPSICGDRDEEWGKDVCTDERMHVLLGDITAKLQHLQSDPTALDKWLGTHTRAGSRLVGHYYESLLHFAFSEIAHLTVALYSEQIPKERQAVAEPSGALVRPFKPPLKSAKDVDCFCNIRRATFLEGRQLRVDFQLKRGKSKDDMPSAESARLRVGAEMRAPIGFSKVLNDVTDGHVTFSDVQSFDDIEFIYAPGFNSVSLQQQRNQAVQGEVDYILWPDLSVPRFVHIEAAVKFYLAAKENVATWDDFIAPNPIDILGLKLRRMLNHQLRMGQTPHIQQLLSEQVAQMNGIDTRQSRESLEIASWMWMNGRLFFHATGRLDDQQQQREAWHNQIAMLSPDLEVGWWCFFEELDATLPDALFYLVLKKPYWLAPLRGSGPRHVDHGPLRNKKQLMADKKTWRSFQYLVVLSYPIEGCPEYEEVCRGFVVPNYWPKKPKGKRRRDRDRSAGSSESS